MPRLRRGTNLDSAGGRFGFHSRGTAIKKTAHRAVFLMAAGPGLEPGFPRPERGVATIRPPRKKLLKFYNKKRRFSIPVKSKKHWISSSSQVNRTSNEIDAAYSSPCPIFYI
jgi:hypothetical protein